MLKVVHIVAGLGREAGGLAQAVVALAQAMAQSGAEVVIATRATSTEPLVVGAETLPVIRFESSCPGCLYFSWTMFCGLRELIATADVVVVHGNWTFPVWWGAHCALATGKPLLMMPHGSWDPVRLAHARWKKFLVGWLDRYYLRRATRLIATAVSERAWLHAALGDAAFSRTLIEPLGVELPPTRPPRSNGEQPHRNLLFLGRLHPLKGGDLLLHAFAQSLRPSWQLIIAGPDEQRTRAQWETLTKSLGLQDRVAFRDAVVGADKWTLIASADCLVLPTRSENFGLVVVEALGCGVPVICTQGAPWADLVTQQCGWWCETSVDGLATALREMMDLSDAQRLAMGECGRVWVKRQFSWYEIGHHWLTLVEQIAQKS